MHADSPEQQRIAHAVTVWGRTVFAAPRRLGDLITRIEARDEVIERVATHIVRRDLQEVRTSTSERRSTRPRVLPETIDPFAHTELSLKADSEYVAQCRGCGASGRMVCGECRGTGNGRCPSCRGTGKVASPKTGRPIQCKGCKATGSAPCRSCAGEGSVNCSECLGSGHQLVWLTIRTSERWEIAMPLESPLVITHPVLRQHRFVAPQELTTATVLEHCSADGPIDSRQLGDPYRTAVRPQLQSVDRRTERVLHQQYMRVAAVRRDATFEMCGLAATLSLSGSDLVGATTAAVRRPIRRRLIAWSVLVVAVAILAGALRNAMLGSSQFFAEARDRADVFAAIAVLCAVPALGCLLRTWRGGLRFHPMRWPVGAWSAGTIVGLALIAIVGFSSQPTSADAMSALAAHDLARAHAVVEALVERQGATRELADLEDRVALAQAERAQGDERLRLLDAVGAHGGQAAGGAVAAARAQRLEQVRQLIAAKRVRDALALLDTAFAGDRSDPIAEERAHAHDTAGAACTTQACRLGEAMQAVAAHPTPDRSASLSQVRAATIASLDPRQVDARDPLARLQQLRRLREAAMLAGQVASDDAELRAQTESAVNFADTERSKVPLLSSSVAIAEELLGVTARQDGGTATVALDGDTVFLPLDRAGRCVGLYAIGGKAHARQLTSKAWPPGRLLSQAVGRAFSVPAPAGGASTSRGVVNGVPIVVRWSEGTVVELRVGNAAP